MASMDARGAQSNFENDRAGGFRIVAGQLARVGRQFHDRQWALGTSGNFSAVLTREPLRLAITSTGVDKGALTARHIVQVNENGESLNGSGRPSDETRLHLTLVRACGAGAVLHTHSIWATLASDRHFSRGGLGIKGYEMLKGLRGVRTHEHEEWLPIIENSQDMRELSRCVEKALQDYPAAHGFLLRRHGLYTWGADLVEAKRHVEILEFLLEVTGRQVDHTALARPNNPEWRRTLAGRRD
jgi:methylthioribulose-1-phosphate dehydratase